MYLGMHKGLSTRGLVRSHVNCININPAPTIFVLMIAVFLFYVSPCPVVLPAAYVKPYGLRCLTDV